MRRMFAAWILAGVSGFAVAGCGNGSNGNADMAQSMPDLAAMAKLNCQGVGSCVYNCLLTGMATSIAGCARTICAPMAKTGSEALWEAAVLCGEGYCTGGSVDAGTTKCVDHKLTGDMGTGDALCDPNVTIDQCLAATYQSQICGPCLTEARNYWIFDETNPQSPGPPTFMCLMASSADCMGANAKCAQQFAACHGDM